MEYYKKLGKVCKRCSNHKPLSSFHKNKSQTDGKHIYCASCVSLMNRESYERNKQSRLEKAQIYRDRNSGKIKYYLRGYQKENPAKYAAHSALRNKRRSESTPEWLTDDQKMAIEAVYQEAQRMTRETGLRHEVDHIVPILGKTVCGLHVPWNLQVVPKHYNTSKGNREWPDMWQDCNCDGL